MTVQYVKAGALRVQLVVPSEPWPPLEPVAVLSNCIVDARASAGFGDIAGDSCAAVAAK